MIDLCILIMSRDQISDNN